MDLISKGLIIDKSKDIHEWMVIAYLNNPTITHLPFDIFFAEYEGDTRSIVEDIIKMKSIYSHYEVYKRL